MNAFRVVLKFVRSRFWLLGVVAVSGLLAGLIVQFPTVPEVEREPVPIPHEEPFVFDEVISHPAQNAELKTSRSTPLRGAWLEGTIEELPESPAVRVSGDLVEPVIERR